MKAMPADKTCIVENERTGEGEKPKTYDHLHGNEKNRSAENAKGP